MIMILKRHLFIFSPFNGSVFFFELVNGITWCVN
jgi:hypothetical protein